MPNSWRWRAERILRARTVLHGYFRTTTTSAWRENGIFLRNVGTLFATTGLSSLAGFVYWTLAAREFTQIAVGYASASVSAITMLGTIGVLGFGTLLIGELPKRTGRLGLIWAALLASAVLSLLLGLAFTVVAPSVSKKFVAICATPVNAALFIAGAVLTAVTLLFDQAAIGLLRGGWQVSRNTAMALLKLLVLVGAATFVSRTSSLGITVSWVAATGLSMLPIAIALRLGKIAVLHGPDWRSLRRLGKQTWSHNCLNLAVTVPRSFMPVLVTVVVSPAANAAFYVAWVVIGFLYILPSHLGTVLFAVSSAVPHEIAKKLRFSLRLSLVTGVPGMVACAVGSPLVLGVFGAAYARMAELPLAILIIGYPSVVVKFHYIAAKRAAGRLASAAGLMVAAALLECAAAVAGGKFDGLLGLTAGVVTAYTIEGVMTAPHVLRVAFSRPPRSEGVVDTAIRDSLATASRRRFQHMTARKSRGPVSPPGLPCLLFLDCLV